MQLSASYPQSRQLLPVHQGRELDPADASRGHEDALEEHHGDVVLEGQTDRQAIAKLALEVCVIRLKQKDGTLRRLIQVCEWQLLASVSTSILNPLCFLTGLPSSALSAILGALANSATVTLSLKICQGENCSSKTVVKQLNRLTEFERDSING